MPLSPSIVKELVRLGAAIPEQRAEDAVYALLQDVVWPEGRFADRSDEYYPTLRGLQFLPPSAHGGFWEGWEEDFSSVDPQRHHPFAFDDTHFYFIEADDFDPSDPHVLGVDHEEVDADPELGPSMQVSRLLARLVLMTPEE